MKQFSVYTKDENFGAVIRYLKSNSIKFEAHINRTRFWIPNDELMMFRLTWGNTCTEVHEDEDYLTGQRNEYSRIN
jgi:hypothetical protein